jgi:methyl-accepting chemotaxis protein
MLILTIVSLAVCISLCVAITKGINSSVGQVSDALASFETNEIACLVNMADRMADGILTSVPTVASKTISIESNDEIGRMANTLNRTLEAGVQMTQSFIHAQAKLSELISSFSASAQKVAETAEALNFAAETVKKDTSEIGNSINNVSHASDESARGSSEIAQGSERLAQSSTEAANAVENLSGMIHKVNQLGQQQKQAADNAADQATQGGQAVTRTVSSMETIRKQVGEASEVVADLGAKGQEIGAIVEAIEAIAEQTNLLSLNAAIEAARAGEHGRGFAVVAEEVRKLAERTSQSTQEIASLITAVRTGVDNAVQSMELAKNGVQEGSQESVGASGALEKILSAMEKVKITTQDVEKAMSGMTVQSERVSDNITSVAAVSEETASSAQELSAMSQEVSAATQTVSSAIVRQGISLNEVSAAIGELRDMAEQLAEGVRQFTVEDKERYAA